MSRTGLCLLLAAASAWSWSAPGHRDIAKLAEQRLTPAASAAVHELLGSEALAQAATWADEVRRDRPAQAGWHFMNIPIDTQDPDPAGFCPATGCVLSKIHDLTTLLRTTRGRTPERVEALKYLVHLVGDLHQPLHVGDRGDRGGNDFQVNFFGAGANLHSVWDRYMVDRLSPSEDELVRQIAAAAQERWTRGTPRDWALESYAVSREIAYKNVSHRMGREYFEQCAPTVRTQLAKAGVRLAAVLNGIWE